VYTLKLRDDQIAIKMLSPPSSVRNNSTWRCVVASVGHPTLNASTSRQPTWRWGMTHVAIQLRHLSLIYLHITICMLLTMTIVYMEAHTIRYRSTATLACPLWVAGRVYRYRYQPDGCTCALTSKLRLPYHRSSFH
jgi:hypothetical protein